MDNELYSIFVRDNKTVTTYNGKNCNSITPIGSVLYDEFCEKLIIDTNTTEEIKFDNIIEVLKYVKENDWFLYDMQNDLYDLETHMLLTENINKLGIGYVVR